MAVEQMFTGTITVELVSADLYGAIKALQNANIEIFDMDRRSDLMLRLRVFRKDWRRLQQIVSKRGEELKIIGRSGLIWSLLELRKRPVFVVGLLAILALTLWVPGRVFFIQIDGNAKIPARQIAETAAQCGISFGASRREVRSEKMKNALLEAMPALSWAGVNTYGCTAVISVAERTLEQSITQEHSVSSIVADRDGVIRQITVLRGTGVCTVGQAVKKGQVLISGYTDCGLSVRATDASGDIFAETNRQMTAVCPYIYRFRQQTGTTHKKYSLIIGKKRIFFSNNSGISGTTCAKIYEQKYITLPGGFVLPVAVAIETWISYELYDATWEQCEQWMIADTRQYVTGLTRGGSIVQSQESFCQMEGTYVLRGIYSCHEMIGTTRVEENILDYVKND